MRERERERERDTSKRERILVERELERSVQDRGKEGQCSRNFQSDMEAATTRERETCT